MASAISGRRTKAGFEVGIIGLEGTQRALKNMAPDLAKVLDTELKQAVAPVIADAKRLIPSDSPMSGWRTTAAKNGRSRGGAGWPAWDSSRAKGGIVWRKGKPKGSNSPRIGRVAYSLQSKDAAAAIFEIAGRRSTGKQGMSHNPNAGRRFIDTLNQRHGTASRALWESWDRHRSGTNRDIVAAINKAETDLTNRVDAAGASASKYDGMSWAQVGASYGAKG